MTEFVTHVIATIPVTIRSTEPLNDQQKREIVRSAVIVHSSEIGVMGLTSMPVAVLVSPATVRDAT